jgi:hypothetical protein
MLLRVCDGLRGVLVHSEGHGRQAANSKPLIAGVTRQVRKLPAPTNGRLCEPSMYGT